MPPTLGKSQVSTARKQMKLQLLSICKTPHASEFQNQITIILSDLGLSSNEVILKTLIFENFKSNYIKKTKRSPKLFQKYQTLKLISENVTYKI